MLVDDIASHLQTAGVGTVGTDIFKGHIPDDDASSSYNDCIALFPHGGDPPELVGGLENPRLTVRVRNTSYSAGMSKANAVMVALHTLNEKTLNGHRYLFVRAVSSLTHLGRDHRGRNLFSIDFIATKEMES